MVRRLVILLCLAAPPAWTDPQEDQTYIERLLESSLSAHYSITTIFDTHPSEGANNTGNVFNFVPHGHLTIRHSAVGLKFDLQGSDEASDTTALLSLRFLPAGLFSEAERGEVHHIIAKVVDRNLIEPALKKVFRRKLGEALVNTLDKTVVDKISDRLASEILSRVPVTASVREFILEIGRTIGDGENVKARAGILLPSIGAPRDDSGRTKLDEKLISGPDLEYTMSYSGRTLGAELSYLVQLNGKKILRITGGVHQAQDPAAALGQVFRNAVFDEGSTELSLAKVDSPYLQVVFSTDRFETYASVADSEGLSAALGLYSRFTPKTSLALIGAYHDRDGDELTRMEEYVETTFRRGVSATLIHDFNDIFTGYVEAESIKGSIGRKRDLLSEKVETGVVYTLSRATRLGLSVYRLERNDDVDTGFKLLFRANF